MKSIVTQEDKKLLLADLCARLPYKVIIYRGEKDYIGEDDALLEGIDVISGICKLRCLPEGTVFVKENVSNIIPYLRPMSSMTEDERKYIEDKCAFTTIGPIGGNFGLVMPVIATEWLIDFYNSHHLDWRGLIEKGLVIKAPEGMYK